MIYGANVWDPVLITAQIISLQCLFYLSLGFWQALFLGRYVPRLTTLQILSWKTFSVSTTAGWLTIISNLINCLIGSVCLMWIVERAKKCLDFASTCYIIHLIVVWTSQGFPASFTWWLTNIIGMIGMALVGEWLCVRREMQEIPINSLRARGAAAQQRDAAGGAGAAGAGSSAEMQPLLPGGGIDVASTGTSTSTADRTKNLTKSAAARASGAGPGPENV